MTQKRYIVIIDDDPDDIGFIADSLREREELEIATFPTGTEALAWLEAAGENSPVPNLIILDMVMPIKDGFDTLSGLRNNTATAAVPVVMLTSSFLQRDIDRCRRAGCAGFFTKPMSIGQYGELAVQLLEFAQPLG